MTTLQQIQNTLRGRVSTTEMHDWAVPTSNRPLVRHNIENLKLVFASHQSDTPPGLKLTVDHDGVAAYHITQYNSRVKVVSSPYVEFTVAVNVSLEIAIGLSADAGLLLTVKSDGIYIDGVMLTAALLSYRSRLGIAYDSLLSKYLIYVDGEYVASTWSNVQLPLSTLKLAGDGYLYAVRTGSKVESGFPTIEPIYSTKQVLVANHTYDSPSELLVPLKGDIGYTDYYSTVLVSAGESNTDEFTRGCQLIQTDDRGNSCAVFISKGYLYYSNGSTVTPIKHDFTEPTVLKFRVSANLGIAKLTVGDRDHVIELLPLGLPRRTFYAGGNELSPGDSFSMAHVNTYSVSV